MNEEDKNRLENRVKEEVKICINKRSSILAYGGFITAMVASQFAKDYSYDYGSDILRGVGVGMLFQNVLSYLINIK